MGHGSFFFFGLGDTLRPIAKDTDVLCSRVSSTLPFAKPSRKDMYYGKVFVATKVPEQPFQFELDTNSCTSTSTAAKTSSLGENFANGSVHGELRRLSSPLHALPPRWFILCDQNILLIVAHRFTYPSLVANKSRRLIPKQKAYPEIRSRDSS